MKRKDIIYNKLLELHDENGIDAKTLSTILNISRANVSHELNILCKEGKLYKSSGRPVLFFIKDNKKNLNKKYELDKLVENCTSLKQPAEQAKAAILYPPKGMPCLILGDTGVGKSMFASLMHKYAVETGIKPKDSPFITFNCADYSNNAQLLTSQLFGVKKGAYTGAESDKIGLIEKANGGILFLDEVHRLPPEGQEALFTFLDTSKFRRMGDDETRTSDVLIISATTEDPNSALLKTFTRRIPMVIKIPSLKDRSLEERLYLIKNFFKMESIKLNRCIYVSSNSIRAFLSYDCPNNIGQLKSDIQLACAKAYSKFLTKVRNDVRICSRDLPAYIQEGLYKKKEHRILWNKLLGEEVEFFKFSKSINSKPKNSYNKNNTIYKFIEQKLNTLKSQGISDIAIENILGNDVIKYFEKNTNTTSLEINKNNLLSIVGEDILNCINKVLYFISNELKINFSNNMYTALALHINALINRVESNKVIPNNDLSKIKTLYPLEFKVAVKAKKIIEDYIHRSIPDEEAAYITIFLTQENKFNHKNKVKVILISHGESTATSMANVANKLLCENCVVGINAPLDVSPSVVLDKLRNLVKKDTTYDGYLLLVDMGSLISFAEVIQEEFNVPVKIIPLVSTLHVLEAARKSLLGLPLDNIYKDVLLVNSYFEVNPSLKKGKNSKNKIAIITACLTGEGGSVAIKSFLNNNLKYDRELFEIICLNCLDKNYFIRTLNKIQKKTEILFIISSFPVDIDIKQYNMYDVINMKVIKELQESIDIKTTLIKMPLIINENISNLDGVELYNNIIAFIQTLESKLFLKLREESKIGLILHLAFLMSRLKAGESSAEYPEKEKYIIENRETYNIVKEDFISLCNKYSIDKVSDSEICYIIRIFSN
ncbi:sigma 54-interacting transcriptional regulator [Clostridium sp.]|jgi:transcriptional regulatory protein LevR/transcriptional regulator with AAA-type ATPase domain|uniref:sigma 54-interacting transcriptional regulator n=1 Tax=Clostridium sp. TaxID=1506 RepID=UPI003A5BD4BD